MSVNLEEEAKWWASEGKEGIPPNNSHIVEGPSPRQLFPTEMLSFPTKSTPAVPAVPEAVPAAPVGSSGESKKSERYIPVQFRKDRSKLNTETVSDNRTRSNKGSKYRPSEHQTAAINLLNKRDFRSRNGGRGIIKLDRTDFFDIDCNDIHIHVYNNSNTGQNGAGIRFRFGHGIELQYNIGDGGRRPKNGFYLVDYRHGKEYTKVSSGKSLSRTIDSLLDKLNKPKSRGSKCQQEILRLNKKGHLEFFIQNIVDAVEIAAGAYQNPMAGKRGGKRKTRRKRKTRKNKRKTRKHKRKRKTRRRKKNKKRKTRRKKR
tara:strand:- start:10297 stop:11244 length:948 start_codon:yes stop_codon:yes gene_type:complete